jgi:hypothetical protein
VSTMREIACNACGSIYIQHATARVIVLGLVKKSWLGMHAARRGDISRWKDSYPDVVRTRQWNLYSGEPGLVTLSG